MIDQKKITILENIKCPNCNGTKYRKNRTQYSALGKKQQYICKNIQCKKYFTGELIPADVIIEVKNLKEVKNIKCPKCMEGNCKRKDKLYGRKDIYKLTHQYECTNSTCKIFFVFRLDKVAAINDAYIKNNEEKKNNINENIVNTVEKYCFRCQKNKTIDNFNNHKNGKNGKQKICKKCNSIIGIAIGSFKALILRLWLHGKMCIDCGESDVDVLQNDHINNDKRKKENGNLSGSLRNNSFLHLLNELKKTEVVCVNCHRLRTQTKIQKNLSLDKEAVRSRLNVKPFRDYICLKKCEIGKCECCKKMVTVDNAQMFDFDHIDSSNKFESVSKMVRYADYTIIQNEIDKCQLLCGNCHLKKTMNEQKMRHLTDFNDKSINLGKKYIETNKVTYQEIFLAFDIIF